MPDPGEPSRPGGRRLVRFGGHHEERSLTATGSTRLARVKNFGRICVNPPPPTVAPQARQESCNGCASIMWFHSPRKAPRMIGRWTIHCLMWTAPPGASKRQLFPVEGLHALCVHLAGVVGMVDTRSYVFVTAS
jgi:hypothetical protein